MNNWRTGRKVPLNVYEGDRPVCQCHNEEDAARIVAGMNLAERASEGVSPQTAEMLHCPLHSAADDLYKALKQIEFWYGGAMPQKLRTLARDALLKANPRFLEPIEQEPTP